MTVTIIGINETMGLSEKIEGVDWNRVNVKEVHRRNGAHVMDVRIENGKRAKVISNGVFKTITVQDEETGRYLIKYQR